VPLACFLELPLVWRFQKWPHTASMRFQSEQKGTGTQSTLYAMKVNPSPTSLGKEEDGSDSDTQQRMLSNSFPTLSGQHMQGEHETEVETQIRMNRETTNCSLDKMTFMLSVSSLVGLSLMVGSSQGKAFIPWFFCILIPFLLVVRFFQYRKRKWQFFLLDFCYTANMLLILQLIAFPKSPWFFLINFITARGPLAIAVMIFRNRLVFHSVDKLTSLCIHVLPGIVTGLIRQFPKECARFWLVDEFHVEAMEENSQIDGTLLCVELPLGVAAIVLVQQCIGNFLSYVVIRIQNDKEYLTLFRYALKKSPRLQNMSERKALLVWMCLNIFFTWVACIPGFLLYTFEGLDLAFFIVILLCATHNGAKFYCA